MNGKGGEGEGDRSSDTPCFLFFLTRFSFPTEFFLFFLFFLEKRREGKKDGELVREVFLKVLGLGDCGINVFCFWVFFGLGVFFWFGARGGSWEVRGKRRSTA